MKLETLREEIDEVDWQILKLIKRRMEISKKIGTFKRLNDLPIIDSEREKQLISNRLKQGTAIDLNESLVRKLFHLLIQDSRKLQI